MRTKNKTNFSFWTVLLISISILLIIQTSFWPDIFSKYNLIPQLTLPIIIYFFSQRDLFPSLILVVFVSLISQSFSVTPLPHLLINYFVICMLTQLSYKFYFGDRKSLFFILLFFISLFMPFFSQNLFGINQTNLHSINVASVFFNSLTTFFCGLLLFPFLQKYIKQEVKFL